MSDLRSTDSTHQTTKKWKLLILLQMVLVVGLFNPWSESVRVVAAIVIGLELFPLVFVALPIFLYQLFVKKKSFSESFAISIDGILSSLWLGL